ncbi:MAG: hypothetical protein LUQ23_01635, partial [Methanomicrobiales archaeon]|nr:hypothetical protein [Methanomicrobiales archaeon]
NTNLALNFNSVDVNGVPVGKPGSNSPALNYTYKEGESTLVTPPDKAKQYTVDSSTDFAAGRINIDMGTIKVNQEWVVNFTLKPMVPGNVRILDATSKVNFIDSMGSPYSLALPDTYISAIPEGTDKGLLTPKLTLYGLIATVVNDGKTAHLTWGIKYENGGADQITEVIEWKPDGLLSYNWASTKSVDSRLTGDSYDLDISNTGIFPTGTYWVRVTGSTTDAGAPPIEAKFTITRSEVTPQILIR